MLSYQARTARKKRLFTVFIHHSSLITAILSIIVMEFHCHLNFFLEIE